MEHTENQVPKEETKEETETMAAPMTAQTPKKRFKPSKKTTNIIGLILIVLIILATAYQFKSIFIAATVNGLPVSRLSVIQELEKRSGKPALDSIITEKLIADKAKAEGVVIKKEEIDAEVKKFEERITKQGGTLTEILAQQGVTEEDLRKQITIRKELEKLLADKIEVTDEEANQYLKDRKVPPTEGMSSADLLNQTKEGLREQKFNQEASKWVADLKANADIKYFVNY